MDSETLRGFQLAFRHHSMPTLWTQGLFPSI